MDRIIIDRRQDDINSSRLTRNDKLTPLPIPLFMPGTQLLFLGS